MKINNLIHCIGISMSVIAPACIFAQSVSLDSIDIEVRRQSKIAKLYDQVLVNVAGNVSDILDNKEASAILQQLLPDTYKKLQECHDQQLILAFAQGPQRDSKAYTALMHKLAPYSLHSVPKNRDEDFIKKFIEYYAPQTEAFEALEDWQQESYRFIVAVKHSYDAELDEQVSK